MKVKLRRHEIIGLFQTLQNLEGRQEAIADGDGKVLAVKVKPFDFSTGTRVTVAKNIRKLKNICSDYEKAQQDTVAVHRAKYPKLSAGLPKDERDFQVSEINKDMQDEIRQFNSEEDEIDIHVVKLEDLKVDTNEFSFAVVSDLMLLTKEEWANRAKENEKRGKPEVTASPEGITTEKVD